ncbi:hypothetical protein HYV88_02880 [Candidatus Woesearchaeota archaeon]|nr:hypothetical protein [Candidatus Woesearchaeota archaeon]
MNNQSTFGGFKEPGFNVNDLVGKPICFYLEGGYLYGVLKEVSDSNLVVIERPAVRIGQRGLESYIESRPTLFPINRALSIREASQEELDNDKLSLVQFERYRDKPVIVRDGGKNSFGILHCIWSANAVTLLPSLVPKYCLYGEYLEWDNTRPHYVAGVIDILETTKENLQRVVDSSFNEYNLLARRAVLEEQKLREEEKRLGNKDKQ